MLRFFYAALGSDARRAPPLLSRVIREHPRSVLIGWIESAFSQDWTDCEVSACKPPQPGHLNKQVTTASSSIFEDNRINITGAMNNAHDH